jgi:hypothetical protein
MAVPESLLASVYEDLRRLAAHQLGREQGGHTLQATALVHEAWLRLDGQAAGNWRNRAQFIAVAAEMMRRVLTLCDTNKKRRNGLPCLKSCWENSSPSPLHRCSRGVGP